MFRRLWEFFKRIFSYFIDLGEDKEPVERRLAYDRAQKSQKVKQMLDKATDVGEVAEMMVQSLAEARIVAANVRDQVKAHLLAAKTARIRGDKKTEENEQAAAASLADDQAEAEEEVKELEQTVSESLKDKEDAKQMVLSQARELEKLARKDARLVSSIRMSEMRTQVTALREAILQLIPEDKDNIRTKIVSQAKRQEARAKARTELVDALWEQKRKGVVDQRTQVSARGAEIMQRIGTEIGYTPTTAMPEPAEVTSEKAASAQ